MKVKVVSIEQNERHLINYIYKIKIKGCFVNN